MIVRLTKFQEYNFHEQLNCHEILRTINSCISCIFIFTQIICLLMFKGNFFLLKIIHNRQIINSLVIEIICI